MSESARGQWNQVTRTLRRLTAVALTAALSAGHAFAWGPQGHRAIAQLALLRVSPLTKTVLTLMLGKPEAMVDASTWADEIRIKRPSDAPLHFIDLPFRAITARDLPEYCKGDCLLSALESNYARLTSGSSSIVEKQEALKYLIHFVGDAHAPQHCIDNEDRGGNMARVTLFGRPANLHTMWDADLVRLVDSPEGTLAARVNPKADPAWANDLDFGDWILESHQVAMTVMYRGIAAQQGYNANISDSYLSQALPVVSDQISKAGVRLAALLNKIYAQKSRR